MFCSEEARDLARIGPKFPWGARLEAFTVHILVYSGGNCCLPGLLAEEDNLGDMSVEDATPTTPTGLLDMVVLVGVLICWCCIPKCDWCITPPLWGCMFTNCCCCCRPYCPAGDDVMSNMVFPSAPDDCCCWYASGVIAKPPLTLPGDVCSWWTP